MSRCLQPRQAAHLLVAAQAVGRPGGAFALAQLQPDGLACTVEAGMGRKAANEPARLAVSTHDPWHCALPCLQATRKLAAAKGRRERRSSCLGSPP